MRISIASTLATSSLALSCLAALPARAGNDDELVPSGKGYGMRPDSWQPPASTKPSSNGINYHGGPLILGTTNVYYIWYGNWGGNSAPTVLTDLATSIGGSPYFNINTTYYD